mmetsp:Transcript_630/g.1660  ORF Transcript_630/g.1660 Transcript_630/m.1660 type:complete len:232 (+) Transcript_630:1267-1962(+)
MQPSTRRRKVSLALRPSWLAAAVWASPIGTALPEAEITRAAFVLGFFRFARSESLYSSNVPNAGDSSSTAAAVTCVSTCDRSRSASACMARSSASASSSFLWVSSSIFGATLDAARFCTGDTMKSSSLKMSKFWIFWMTRLAAIFTAPSSCCCPTFATTSCKRSRALDRPMAFQSGISNAFNSRSMSCAREGLSNISSTHPARISRHSLSLNTCTRVAAPASRRGPMMPAC